MADQKETRKDEKTRQAELSDEQLEAASGGVPTSKWKGKPPARQLKTAD